MGLQIAIMGSSACLWRSVCDLATRHVAEHDLRQLAGNLDRQGAMVADFHASGAPTGAILCYTLTPYT